MDVNWDIKLKNDQRSNPAVFHTKIELPREIPIPTEIQLRKVFEVTEFSKAKRLKTWGRSIDSNGDTILIDDPHWIAVRNGTPLHIDPKYPRYSHQLKIRVDHGTFVRGVDKEELMLERGVFYILDTHSPHQVFLKHKQDAWNISISIDSWNMWEPQTAINTLLDWGIKSDFITGKLIN